MRLGSSSRFIGPFRTPVNRSRFLLFRESRRAAPFMGERRKLPQLMARMTMGRTGQNTVLAATNRNKAIQLPSSGLFFFCQF